MKVKLLSRVRLLVTPWTAAYQAPPSMGFSRQEYWSGVPLPSLNEGLGEPKLKHGSTKIVIQSVIHRLTAGFRCKYLVIIHCMLGELVSGTKLKGGGWTSLVVQWLRICLPMQGTQVRSLLRGDSTGLGATKPVSYNYEPTL